mmetsp:Transcript_6704/g.13296  ORF Transcript_6704/g.13296 Transcript_6704/m.13296 type:complete len:224 (+) Transcript_6704:425-1096(+)
MRHRPGKVHEIETISHSRSDRDPQFVTRGGEIWVACLYEIGVVCLDSLYQSLLIVGVAGNLWIKNERKIPSVAHTPCCAQYPLRAVSPVHPSKLRVHRLSESVRVDHQITHQCISPQAEVTSRAFKQRGRCEVRKHSTCVARVGGRVECQYTLGIGSAEDFGNDVDILRRREWGGELCIGDGDPLVTHGTEKYSTSVFQPSLTPCLEGIFGNLLGSVCWHPGL